MIWKRFIRSCVSRQVDGKTSTFRFVRGEAGMTIMELMVASVLGLSMMAMSLGVTLAQRRLYEKDLVRLRLLDNLRSASDIVGMAIKQAGENLPGNFPAVQLVDGTSGNADELIIRRNLLDEVIMVCVGITSGSTAANITFADVSGNAGCSRSDNLQSYNQFRANRLTAGGTVKAYIYDFGTGLGEFINYSGEADNGTILSMAKGGTAFSRDYPMGSAVYILEEWRFRLVNDTLTSQKLLEIVENGDTATAKKVVFGLRDMQMTVTKTDGSVLSAFAYSDDWTAIRKVDVSLTGRDTYRGTDLDESLAASFFPRNVLSN